MAPWLAAETQLKRKVCFSAALELHRTFIDAAAKPIRPSSSGGRMVLAKQPEEIRDPSGPGAIALAACGGFRARASGASRHLTICMAGRSASWPRRASASIAVHRAANSQPGQRPSDKKAKKALALHKEGLSYRLIGRNLGLSKNTVMEIVKARSGATFLAVVRLPTEIALLQLRRHHVPSAAEKGTPHDGIRTYAASPNREGSDRSSSSCFARCREILDTEVAMSKGCTARRLAVRRCSISDAHLTARPAAAVSLRAINSRSFDHRRRL